MRVIPIPSGPLGVSFNGNPPMVTDVRTDSPMGNKLHMGDIVHGVSVPGLQVHHVEDSRILSEILQKTTHLQNRYLNVSTESDSCSTSSEMEFHVTIPSGKLGLTFDGDHQPTVCKVWEYCPVQGFVQEGQWLKSIQIPGEAELACASLSARDVYEVLRCRARTKGRVLVLTNPPVAVAEPVTHPMDEVPHLTPESHVYSAVPTEPMSVSSSTCSTSLDATIENGIVTVQLHPKQRVRADHENMIYMSDCFRVKTHGMNVRQFQKGYELGLAEFIYEGLSGRGTVAFGGGDKVVQIKLEDYDNRVICQAGSYLCSEMPAKVYIESVSDGSILLRVCGNGTVWLSGSGSIIAKILSRGQSLRCATRSIVAFEKSVRYSSHRLRGGLKSALTGKEQCSWAELVGPGSVWLQGSVADTSSLIPSNRDKSEF